MQQLKKIFLVLAAMVIVVVAIYFAVYLHRAPSASRPSDQIPTVVTQDAGLIFMDSFVLLQSPLPESFAAGTRSIVDGWDSLTIVPVGNTDNLPTYPFVIDYRTRKAQAIGSIPSFLQATFAQPFSIEKSVNIVGQTVQEYQSTGTGAAYKAVVFDRRGQNVLILAKAANASDMPSYVGAYDAFLSGMTELAK